MKTLQHKRATASILAANNPVLPAGEIGIETDTGRSKVGDGVKTWNNLPYTDSPAASSLFLWSNFR